MLLLKKQNVFLGNQNKNFICRQCLNSYTSEHTLNIQKRKCENTGITTIRTSGESHLNWKHYFPKNPKYFRIIADFEADRENKISSIGNRTINIYLKNPVCNGYFIISELEDVLKSGY